MIKNFETVCTSFETGYAIEQRAEQVLDILLAHKGEGMRMKEIAALLQPDTRWPSPCTYELTCLKKLGLVDRYEVEGEPIQVPDERWVEEPVETRVEKYKVQKEITINGHRYLLAEGEPEFDEVTRSTWGRGHWEQYTRTITPKIALFKIAML